MLHSFLSATPARCSAIAVLCGVSSQSERCKDHGLVTVAALQLVKRTQCSQVWHLGFCQHVRDDSHDVCFVQGGNFNAGSAGAAADDDDDDDDVPDLVDTFDEQS